MWYFEKIILQCGQSSMNEKLTMIGLIATAELHSRKPEHRFCVASNLMCCQRFYIVCGPPYLGVGWLLNW